MMLLLVLVYVTIDQMRPANVLRQIHHQTLGARELQADLRRRTFREPRGRGRVTATYRSDATGYVTGIDLERLAKALEQAPRAEIQLCVTLGRAVTYGDVLAVARDDDEDTARSLADQVRPSILLDRWRDISRDATTGVGEITNIAWTSGSTAKHSPQVARQGLDILKDLTARRLDEHDPSAPPGDMVRVVYPDTYLDQLLDSIYSILVCAHESHQHLTAAGVLDTYRLLLPQTSAAVRSRMLRDIEIGRELLDDMPRSAMLERARTALQHTIERVDRDLDAGATQTTA
jgi:hypothetical protein